MLSKSKEKKLLSNKTSFPIVPTLDLNLLLCIDDRKQLTLRKERSSSEGEIELLAFQAKQRRFENGSDEKFSLQRSTPPFFYHSSNLPTVTPSLSEIFIHDKQKKLQNQLVRACIKADLPKVQQLIQKGANPKMGNEDGDYPMAAAIWRLAFDIMDHLEQHTIYTQKDWLNIGNAIQRQKGSLVPQHAPIKTYGDLLEHYNADYATWLYKYEACCKTLNHELTPSWNRNEHILNLNQLSMFADSDNKVCCIMGAVKTPKIHEKTDLITTPQVDWFNKLCCIMLARLRGKGLAIDQHGQLDLSNTLQCNMLDKKCNAIKS